MSAMSGRPSSCPWDLEEIVSYILQWLPPATLLRARLVCKTWNRIVLSQRRSKISKPCYFHFLRHNWPFPRECQGEVVACRMFDPSLSSWVRISCPTTSPRLDKLHLLRTEGNSGLVAFYELGQRMLNGRYPPLNFWVGNPLTNKWKFIEGLPVLLEHGCNIPSLNFLVTEGPPARYKIVASGCLPLEGAWGLMTMIFDSTTGEWRPGASYPFAQRMANDSAIYNGCIYFLNRLSCGMSRGMCQLVCYSPEHDRFDVIAQARIKNKIPDGIVFLEDDPVPVLVVLRHSGLLYLELHQDVQGAWALKKSSRAAAVDAGLVISAEPPWGSAQPDYRYVATDFDAVSMHEPDNPAFRAHSRCFLLLDKMAKERHMFAGEICSFRPRFDMEP